MRENTLQGLRVDRERVIARLREHEPELRAAGGTTLSLFGSVARGELDALYFQLYGISRDDASYILDTFPIIRRKDEQQCGDYRTKRVIFEIYDAMAEAKHSGIPYQTPRPAARLIHARRMLQS